jgi:hypothetical protein
VRGQDDAQRFFHAGIRYCLVAAVRPRAPGACLYQRCWAGDYERNCRPPPPSARGGGPSLAHRSARLSRFEWNLLCAARWHCPVQQQKLRRIQFLVSAPDQRHLDLASDKHDAEETTVRLWMRQQILF